MLQLHSIISLININSLNPSSKYWFFNYSNQRNLSTKFIYIYKLTLENKQIPSSYYTLNYSIFFLRKEPFYTKLKYSRVPQFDTSSGAIASFLSGFYGFIVCEKFGFELIDSGDFFFLVIYLMVIIQILSSLILFFNTTLKSIFKPLILIIRSFIV